MKENKKKTPVGLIIGIVVGGVVLFVVVILLLVVFLLKSGTNIYQGKWECNNNIEVTIGNNNFDMYGNSNTYVYSKYVPNKVEIDNNISKCTIRATATKRVLNGKEYTGNYTTEYQLAIDNNNKDEMAMINTQTYSMYKCKRK